MTSVSADLALAVVGLRRTAEAGGAVAGLPPSVWLDLNCPDWRDSLPVVVDGASGRRLIDGLMKAMAIKGGSGAVRASRLLEKVGGAWQSGPLVAHVEFAWHLPRLDTVTGAPLKATP
jgi:hypothetical protein